MRKEIIGVFAALAFIGLAIWLLVLSPEPSVSVVGAPSLGQAIWGFRPLDVLLQVLLVLAGTFSILTLVRERKR